MKKKCFRLFLVLASCLLIFSNLSLSVLAGPNKNSTNNEWQFAAFGSNTSEEKNPRPLFHEDGSFRMDAKGGKIASSEEGLSFYFMELPADSNFELHTTVKVDRYSPDSQRSFGLMVRDQVADSGDSGKITSNYLAVGGLDDQMRGFYNQAGLTKMNPFDKSNPPVTGESYDLSIKKSGESYEVAVNGEKQAVSLPDGLSDKLYAGFYVARDAAVTFEDYSLNVADQVPDHLQVDAEHMKQSYLIGEQLHLEGLLVTAVYSDGSRELLDSDDFFITGFDSTTAGTTSIAIHYAGASAELNLEIRDLALTDLHIKYNPAKTDYYLQDTFEPDGLVVEAEFDEGYLVEELEEEQLQFVIDGEIIDPADYRFNEPGGKMVIVQPKQNPAISVSFQVTVSEAELTGLEIQKAPVKTTYYPGDELDLAGLIVEATYSDGYVERVMRRQLTASEIDTETLGNQQVKLFYKQTETAFTIQVKEKELQGLKVMSYPKTTYQIGEEFTSKGLKVGKLYDNQDVEQIDETAYQLDTSAFNGGKTGVYPIQIIPTKDGIDPITFDVTVRDPLQPEWKSIQFGQSTGPEKNYIEQLDNGAVRIVAEPGAGKVTGDHDGITFYYTEVDAESDNFQLSADITVREYAKSPAHDGQESFGIMARDAIGKEGDSGVFASNIAAIGGFSGGTQEKNGTQLFIRTGVETPDDAGSNGIQKMMLDEEKPTPGNTYPEEAYRLTLSKTNSGFSGQINDGEQAVFFEPDILNVQDSKMYVGFYTARLADIEVHDIEFEATAQATDPPKVDPPAEPVKPKLEVLSRSKTSESAYELRLRPNVDGFVTVKQGEESVARFHSLQAGETSAITTDLNANQANDFSISFVPDDTQYLTDYKKIVQNFTVSMKTFRSGRDIHAAPNGSPEGTGTKENPLDLDTAIAYVQPGQKIILADGNYERNQKLEIEKYNDGTEEARKYLVAEDGARPVIDFDKKSEGVVLSGDYWHVTGIDFTRSAGNTKGFTVGGSHNIIEQSRFYENGDTGLQISRTISEAPSEEWPSDNLVLNSESFDNRDPSDNNADGFAAKLTAGENNVFRGCIAHHNIDDGWDLYTKAGTGAIGAVLIEDSVAYENGTLSDGTVGDGDKNGFKLGGEGIHVPHVIKDSIAFSNGAAGFTSNSNPGVIAENNVAYDNAGGNIDFSTYGGIESDFTINRFISYQTAYTVSDVYPADLASGTNFFFDGEQTENSTGVNLTDESFVSLEPELPYQRDAEGAIIKGDFLKVQLPAEITLHPHIIKKNKGKKSGKRGPKLNVFIELDQGINLENIEVNKVKLDGDLRPIDQKSMKIGDHDKDGIPELKLQFSRSALEAKLEKGKQLITIDGELTSGLPFQGQAEILVK
ncbi:exopolygalacturonate lyase [Sediminibacillus dalangtanensis]|uniref:Exopolygalacturonate lyase n=1 Tax=Sediminibacillus dalangtanensis TaxID=2729421 RepID=A0ABX7VQK6_9BACI|nr:bacterial Ig-like domain-containing protein [Sediminibacillus dalangtanensis]QTM99149.1 exopolygalacturonate lyase [Sediminibacillus dalangtanensis]